MSTPSPQASRLTSWITASRVSRNLVLTMRRLEALGLVVGTTGNGSVRVGDDLLITPTRFPYDQLRSRNLVRLPLTGEQRANTRAASRELPLHLEIYGARPDISAIVHTHSLMAIIWSSLGRSLIGSIEEARYYGIEEIRLADPAPSASIELAHSATKALGSGSAVLLPNHGVVAVGRNLQSALHTAQAVEHIAAVAVSREMMTSARTGIPLAIGNTGAAAVDDYWRPA